MMPLMPSRFRRGFTPRRFFGIATSIAASCSSVSQNRFDIAGPSVGTIRIEPDGVRSIGNWVSTLLAAHRQGTTTRPATCGLKLMLGSYAQVCSPALPLVTLGQPAEE